MRTLLPAERGQAAGITLKLNQVTVTYYYGSGKNQPWLAGAHGHHRLDVPRCPRAVLPAVVHVEGRLELGALQERQLRQARPASYDCDRRRGEPPELRQADGLDHARRNAGDHLATGSDVNRAMAKKVNGVTSDPAEFLDLTTAYLA